MHVQCYWNYYCHAAVACCTWTTQSTVSKYKFCDVFLALYVSIYQFADTIMLIFILLYPRCLCLLLLLSSLKYWVCVKYTSPFCVLLCTPGEAQGGSGLVPTTPQDLQATRPCALPSPGWSTAATYRRSPVPHLVDRQQAQGRHKENFENFISMRPLSHQRFCRSLCTPPTPTPPPFTTSFASGVCGGSKKKFNCLCSNMDCLTTFD